MDTQTRGRLLSGADLRRLLLLRQRIRDEVVDLPRDLKREVLRALEQARQVRLHGVTGAAGGVGAVGAGRTLPEMTSAELLRAIKWRTDSASLVELAAAARALDRGRRMAAARARRTADRHPDR